jgi:ATP-binding cassette subfamily B protein
MPIELTNNVFSFMWYFIKPYKNTVLVFIFMSFLTGLWGPLNTLILRYIVNILSTSTSFDINLLFYPSILMVFNFIILDNIAWRVLNYLAYKYLPVIKNNITTTLFVHILDLDYKFFQDNLSGKIASNITILADNIEKILYPLVPNLLRGISLVIAAFIAAYYINLIFFFVMLIWLFMFVCTSIYMSKKIIEFADIYSETESAISGELVDSISNVHNIRIFAQKNYEIFRVNLFLENRLKAYRTQEFRIIMINVIQGILIASMLALSLYFLIFLYQRKLVRVGDFTLILGLAIELGHMIWRTMSCLDEFNKASGKCTQSLKNIIVDIKIYDKEGATDLLIKHGKITFKNVKFHYQNNSIFSFHEKK